MSNDNPNTNPVKVIEFLLEVARTYGILGENIRAGSFATAAASIKTANMEIISAGTDVAHLNRIGPSTIKEVQQFIDTGTSDRFEALTARINNGESTAKSTELNDALDIINRLKAKKAAT